MIRNSTEFQFHSGTIRSAKVMVAVSVTMNFNSTLVRLEAITLATLDSLFRISIPLWYD